MAGARREFFRGAREPGSPGVNSEGCEDTAAGSLLVGGCEKSVPESGHGLRFNVAIIITFNPEGRKAAYLGLNLFSFQMLIKQTACWHRQTSIKTTLHFHLTHISTVICSKNTMVTDRTYFRCINRKL